ncbi:MAG: DUF2971 domain-containing protein [Roseiarcus sp.]
MAAKSHLPKHVVRFYGTVDFALDAIAHRQVTFVHTSKLNDPFDPYFFFETDFEGSYANLLKYVRKKHPDDERWFTRLVPSHSWEQTVAEIVDHCKKLRDHTYVLSTSAPQDGTHPKDNLYMRGHYGSGHRGVAIEFDPREIAKPLIQEHKQQKGVELSESEVWIKTQYAARLDPLICAHFLDFFRNERDGGGGKTELEKHYDRASKTKSLVWKSENEWRLQWTTEDTKLKIHRSSISEKAISAVYIGESASKSTEEDIAFEVKRKFPDAKVFKAQKQLGAFALNFKPLA